LRLTGFFVRKETLSASFADPGRSLMPGPSRATLMYS
jgi:hypothetical protein